MGKAVKKDCLETAGRNRRKKNTGFWERLWNDGLKLIDTFGIRVFWHLQQNQEKHEMEEWQKQMIQLEVRVSEIEEYRKIALFHHLLFIKEF